MHYYFYAREIIFNISINKATDTVRNNRNFDYYKVSYLLQHASDSAAGVEAHERRATIRVGDS